MMPAGAQIALYPMSDRFLPLIMDALAALDPYRAGLRIETDDLSTLLAGPSGTVFAATRALFLAAAAPGAHVALSAAFSRGCPGEPGNAGGAPLAERQAAACAAVERAAVTGTPVAAQLALHPLGTPDPMAEIAGCIGFLRQTAVFARPKPFCTRLAGDAGPVFAALEAAFLHFGPHRGHVVMDVTVSAHSPSARRG